MTRQLQVFSRAFPSLGIPFVIAKDTQPTFLLFSNYRFARSANIYILTFLYATFIWVGMLGAVAYHNLEIAILVVFWSFVYFFIRPISLTQNKLFAIASLQIAFLLAELIFPSFLEIKQLVVYTAKSFVDSGRGVAGIFGEPTDNSFLQLVISLKLLMMGNGRSSYKLKFFLLFYNLLCFLFTLSLFSLAVFALTIFYLFLSSVFMALFFFTCIVIFSTFGYSFFGSSRVITIFQLLINGQYLDILYGTSAFYRFAPIWEFKEYVIPVALHDYKDLTGDLQFTSSSGVTRRMYADDLADIYTMLKRMPFSLGFYVYGSLLTLCLLLVVAWKLGIKWLPFLVLLGCMTVSPFSPIFLILFAREEI